MDQVELSKTKVELLEAAKRVLLKSGYSDLSTRKIAAEASTQMSQIRYHFGSKEGLILALYEYMTSQLLDRQSDMFSDPNLTLSQKWERSCDYLDQDLETGYVRVLQELIAAGWSNENIGDVVRHNLAGWRDMHIALAEEFFEQHGKPEFFDSEDIAALVGSVFVGAEAFILLGYDNDHIPTRRALRSLGRVIAHFESSNS